MFGFILDQTQILFWGNNKSPATEVLQNSNPIILHQFLSPELFN
jgi:hypothetical protein